jgi:L-cysteine:1D-myo-inositol 2-amino-2-deoxy-alpha-D-glucopyranoside ligase
VIAQSLLGDTIDVQGGGNDLLFPHHECSAAHAEVLPGKAPFASHYVHAGMIGLNGEKMSSRAATWCSSRGCAADGSTRWRCGSA